MPNDDKKAIFGGCLCRAVRYRSVDRPLVARCAGAGVPIPGNRQRQRERLLSARRGHHRGPVEATT